MRKKVIVTTTWFIIILILTSSISCTNDRIDLGYEFQLGQDDQFFFINRTGNSGFVESKSGYYFFCGQLKQYLYYMDKNTMKPVILCNKPNCLHTEETDGTKTLDCNAFFNDDISNMTLYNNNLFYIDTSMNMAQSLYKLSLDGTKREKLLSFKEKIDNLIIHRSYIYYSTSDSGTVNGKEDSTTTTCKVFRVKMEEINQEPELLYTVSGIYEMILQLKGYNNGVYIHSISYNNSATQIISNLLYKYDIKTNGITELKENLGLFLFCKDKMVYCDNEFHIFTDELDKTARVPLNNIIGVPINIDEKYIYVQNWDEKKGNSFAIYERSGILIKDFGYLGRNYDAYGGNDKYIFIVDNGEKSNEFGAIQALYVIDKDKIGNGAASLEKIFEYVPKVTPPGVTTYYN